MFAASSPNRVIQFKQIILCDQIMFAKEIPGGNINGAFDTLKMYVKL